VQQLVHGQGTAKAYYAAQRDPLAKTAAVLAAAADHHTEQHSRAQCTGQNRQAALGPLQPYDQGV